MKFYAITAACLLASAAGAQSLTDAINAVGDATKPNIETNVQIGMQMGGEMTNNANALGEGSAAAAGQNAMIDASTKSGIKTNIQAGLQTGGSMKNTANAVDGGMAAAGQNAMIKK